MDTKRMSDAMAEKKEALWKPRFSFVMPTYNRAFCIKKAIDSLLRQKSTDFELIVIDDGSTDGTETLVKDSYASDVKQKRIVYNRLEENAGVCKARNVGLSLARGEWIAYLDSDNEITEDFIETIDEAIGKNPDTEAFYAKIQFANSQRVVGKPFDFEELRLHNFIDIGAYVHRRSLFEQEGGFDEKMTRLVDWELIIRYSARSVPKFIDRILLRYDDSKKTNRITNQGRSSYYVNLNYIRRKHCADYPVVTTAVTTYNHEKFIAQALDSVVAQEGRFVHEILVSDDCSTDDTHAIIQEYAKKNPGLIFDISGGGNVGISGNMRKCIAAAKGRYIAWLEGDDYWVSSRKLGAQADFLESRPECSFVFCAITLLTSKGLSSCSPLHSWYERLSDTVTGSDFFKHPLFMGGVGSFSACMYRTAQLKSLPECLYRWRLSELALAFYLEQSGPIGFLRDEYTIYRKHSGGVWSGAGELGRFLQRVRCREQVRQVCRKEYVPLVDADIAKCEEALGKYIGRIDSERRAFAKECRRLQRIVRNVQPFYRIAMFAIWPVRKVRGGIKCLRENGVGYTVSRFAGKVRERFCR